VEKLAEYLAGSADEIADEVVGTWQQVGEREPWHRVPENLDQDHLPEMIRALARTALADFFAPDARRELVRVGAIHGQHRFLQGVAEEILGREYEMLRFSLRSRLSNETDSQRASEALIRLDSAMTLAHGASLRGFHRDQIETEPGRYDAELERYASEWVFGLR